MNKKTKYWIIGITTIIILLIICFIAASKAKNKNETRIDNNMVSNRHSDMNHGKWGSQNKNSDQNVADYLAAQDKIMADMMGKMKNIQKSGDASIYFLYGMIPHHESAVSMAESLIKYGGENKSIHKLATDIIELQKTEIEQMRSMIQTLESNIQKDEANETAYLKDYHEMFEESHAHHTDNRRYQSVDEAFAEGMIMHHEMAVDMSETILDHNAQEQVKELAKNIIDLQEQEIDQMQDILENLRAL